jgi:taurine dioxygenase
MMLDFTPLSSEIGVRVSGLNLNQPISEGDAGQLRQALKRHYILLFRQGPINEEQHIRLMGALGNVIAEAPGSEALFQWVSTDPTQYVGGTYPLLWHSDGQFTRTGALQAISLNAIEMERNEPTIFSDQVRAARVLPAELRERIKGLELLQAIDLSSNQERVRCRLSQKAADVPLSQFPSCKHPLLGTHPYTGEEMLNLSQLFSSHIIGMTDEESDAIFAELELYQYEPSAQYRHDWEVNDLLIWDNVALQHSRPAIAKPAGRRLRRVAINPIGNKELMAGVKPAASRQIGADIGW